jgi:hypothetical protein
MALYFLDYDLRKARNYQMLYDELATFKAVRVLESSWCFNRFSTNCAGLRDHFQQFIDADDGLSVVEVTEWATYKPLGTPKQL